MTPVLEYSISSIPDCMDRNSQNAISEARHAIMKWLSFGSKLGGVKIGKGSHSF